MKKVCTLNKILEASFRSVSVGVVISILFLITTPIVFAGIMAFSISFLLCVFLDCRF